VQRSITPGDVHQPTGSSEPLRLAWFKATRPDAGAPADRTAPAIERLRRTHDVEIVTVADAWDFVWKHNRQPYDVCVYEPGSAPAQQFIWPYLLHYPGVVVLHATVMRDVRAWSGSRIVVVFDAAVAQSLEDEHPAARLRHVAPGVPTADSRRRAATSPLRVGMFDDSRREVVERAAQRARDRGAAVRVLDTPHEADIIVALDWPPAAGPPAAALHAMASGLPAIVLEVEATADWPALDPQNWRPRAFSAEAPIAVSIDPRDEEHSLMLAMARLAADAPLRSALGTAGHAWWRAHATIEHAAAGWDAILREAATLGPPSPQPVADGSESARRILGELGVAVDFL